MKDSGRARHMGTPGNGAFFRRPLSIGDHEPTPRVRLRSEAELVCTRLLAILEVRSEVQIGKRNRGGD